MNLSFQVQNLLKQLKSSQTKVEISSDIKKEEYSFISDTIYISPKDKCVQKGLENANPFCLKLISMHKAYFSSKQSKLLHALKFFLTNISIIMFALAILFRLVLGKSRGVCVLTAVIILLSLILNVFMTSNAFKRACVLIKKNITKIDDEDISKENVNNVEKLVAKNKLKLIINKEKYRIVMLITIIILMI